MPSYDHERNAQIDLSLIESHFPVAYERASKHCLQRVAEAIPNGCPSTTVGELVLKIIQNGRKSFRENAALKPLLA